MCWEHKRCGDLLGSGSLNPPANPPHLHASGPAQSLGRKEEAGPIDTRGVMISQIWI